MCKPAVQSAGAGLAPTPSATWGRSVHAEPGWEKDESIVRGADVPKMMQMVLRGMHKPT